MATGTRVSKAAKAKAPTTPLGSHATTLGKKNPLSVPSPIPTAGLPPAKPTNPLAPTIQNPGHRPIAVSKQIYGATNTVKSMVSSSMVKTTKPMLANQIHVQNDNLKTRAPANPLTAMHPAASYVPPKTSPPPNPLNAMPSEQAALAPNKYVVPTNSNNLPKKTSTTVSTTQQQFPSLPNQISVLNSGTRDTSSSPANAIMPSSGVKIKVEGNQ
eukprot:CAMPEP_0197243508 /NCGR_PEP_ID=MMETSP1429-20130617/8949_1 /TAXON_ID=49237 /ORGANISM="Chaetoceros  sp., Strain UNC1202" /LENGTH=213 /DNA_ID=CAMNT_0042703747 /DNA_START=24 /DNA_END=665 /DNA_ORIENTATION=+